MKCTFCLGGFGLVQLDCNCKQLIDDFKLCFSKYPRICTLNRLCTMEESDPSDGDEAVLVYYPEMVYAPGTIPSTDSLHDPNHNYDT